MRINLFLTLISIVLSLLIGYLVYNVAEGQNNDVACGIGCTMCLMTTFIPTLGMKYDSIRLGTNIRVMSALFSAIFLISHFCFAIIGIKLPYYIIINGIILTIFLALTYKISFIKSI